MINKLFTFGGLPVEEQKQGAAKRLPLNLQFFADDNADDEGDNASDDDNGTDDDFDVDSVLEKPEVKERIEKRFKEQLGKRMKNKDKEIERLKAELGGKTEKPDDEGDNKRQKTEVPDEVTQRLERAERREKVAVLKGFAVDEGIDAFLFQKFVDLKDVELDEDGEPVNLDELLEALRDDARTARYFAVTDNEDADEDEPTRKRYVPGDTKQKTNSKKKVNLADIGKQKALERHQKKEDK